MSECDNVQAALEAGNKIATLGAEPKTIGGGIPFFPGTGQSAERFLAAPVRPRAAVAIRDAASFIDYVKTYKDSDSLVFANLGDRTITAVLDYHRADGSARWGEHRATLTCLLTEDWKRWMGANKKRLSQVDFAQFIEDNIPNIASPDGAALVDMTRTLEAKKSVTFASSVRLDNGEHQLTFEETVQGSAQKGTVQIPSTFALGIEPFEGAEKYRVDARFRYRIDSGVLSMWFDLIRPEAVVEDAFKRTRQLIADAIAPVKVLAASAPDIK